MSSKYSTQGMAVIPLCLNWVECMVPCPSSRGRGGDRDKYPSNTRDVLNKTFSGTRQWPRFVRRHESLIDQLTQFTNIGINPGRQNTSRLKSRSHV